MSLYKYICRHLQRFAANRPARRKAKNKTARRARRINQMRSK